MGRGTGFFPWFGNYSEEFEVQILLIDKLSFLAGGIDKGKRENTGFPVDEVPFPLQNPLRIRNPPLTLPANLGFRGKIPGRKGPGFGGRGGKGKRSPLNKIRGYV
ncbi:MAG: hypothetical protein CM15mP6_0470 [Methanobacteriota archaeon]|nr:MAG: hypothetical protein CM15mP6_0470 [Euryarchaeota archaeon]